jgi:hypothetical protein
MGFVGRKKRRKETASDALMREQHSGVGERIYSRNRLSPLVAALSKFLLQTEGGGPSDRRKNRRQILADFRLA